MTYIQPLIIQLQISKDYLRHALVNDLPLPLVHELYIQIKTLESQLFPRYLFN